MVIRVICIKTGGCTLFHCCCIKVYWIFISRLIPYILKKVYFDANGNGRFLVPRLKRKIKYLALNINTYKLSLMALISLLKFSINVLIKSCTSYSAGSIMDFLLLYWVYILMPLTRKIHVLKYAFPVVTERLLWDAESSWRPWK